MNDPLPKAWTIGMGAHGVGVPSERRTTPELCPWFFHPPVTYHPQLDRTWCLCGRKTYPGRCAITFMTSGHGALTEPNPAYLEWQRTSEQATTTSKEAP